MTYHFPPDPRPDWLLLVVHTALAAMCIGSLIGFVRGTCRPARLRDFAIWAGLIGLSWLLALQVMFEQYQAIAAFNMAFTVTFVSGMAMAITSLRLMIQGPAEDRQVTVLISVGMIAAFLFALLPDTHSRSPGPRSICRYNLKRIGLGLWNAEDARGRFPPAIVESPVRRSWRIDLLPFVDWAPLRATYDESAEWDSSANSQFALTKIDPYVCPANFNPVDSRGRRYTAYAAVTGDGTIFDHDTPRKPSEVTDGTSNTMLVIEACGQEIVWSEPRDVDVSTVSVGINLSGSTKTTSPSLGSSYHLGGCQMLMGDGTVRFVSEKIDPTVLKAISTATGGETVDDF